MLRPCKEVGVFVKFVCMCGRLTSTWPPDPGASVLDNLVTEIVWLASFLNVLALLIPLMLAVYHYHSQLGALMKSLSELTALSEVFLNLILCRIERPRLQKLLSELTNYITNAKASERLILQKYVNRYLPFLMAVGGSYVMTAVAFSCGPIMITTSLPADAWYPFSIEPLFIKCALYALQVLAILQTGLCITVDVMVGMMLWYTAARLEILYSKIINVINEAQLNTYIEEHQKIILFAEETANAVRLIILKGNVTMAIVVICGGFPLIRVSDHVDDT